MVMDPLTADDLLRVPLLASLSPDVRSELAQRFEVEEFGTGRNIVSEGVAGYAFYVLDRGTVEVSQAGVVLRTLGPGDFFGEISILGEGRRTATVIATEPAVVWTLFGTAFRVLQMNRPDVADSLEAAMKDRLAAD
jgi:CRP/FNR family transcriptional regulator, cyclic AMP receptor protein